MADVGWPEIAAHRERLLRIARRRCPSREDAEDVVQEALLRCATFEHLDRARLGAFLTSVTVRLCADLYRDAERSQRAFRRLELGVVPDPEEGAVRAAEAAEIGTALERLPDRQRAVLVDRASGLSVPEIGRRHSLTYKATESALSRARAAMRVALSASAAVLGALVATLRRRPVAVTAVPVVATLALAGGVLHVRLPFDDGHAEAGGRRVPMVLVPAAQPGEVERHAPAAPRVRRPAAAVAVRPPAAVVPGTTAHTHEYVDVTESHLGSRTRVSDTDEPIDQKLARCVMYGAHVHVVVSPDETGVKNECGYPDDREDLSL